MEKEEMLRLLTSIAEGIAKTMGKNCETLIQDLALASHPILAIFNGQVTGREVGSTEDVFGQISKQVDEKLMQRPMVNMMVLRGRQKIKSTTMIVRGADYCYGLGINLDVTLAAAYSDFLSDYLSIENYLDAAIDSARKDRLEEVFADCVQALGKTPAQMKREDRIALIRMLKERHAFDFQRAVPIISEKLGVTRYTVYNYLKELGAD